MSALPPLPCAGRSIDFLPVERLAVYVHIPFCTSRCRYCNFAFETGWSPAVMARTLNAILAESRLLAPRLLAGGGRVASLYFGGGTPSVVPAPELDAFLAEFLPLWGLPAAPGPGGNPEMEFAFEANPESLSPELLATLGRRGANRLSLGVQTFDSRTLRRLGRRAGPADLALALEAIAQARAEGSWQGRLNLDLITGLPGQTPDEARADVQAILAAHPDHVSLYTLTEEPGTPLAQGYAAGLWPRPEPELVEAMALEAAAALEAAGLRAYEVSNYARPGAESRHNLAYWRLDPYVGLGPGAVGTLPVRLDGRLTPLRLTNPGSPAYARPGSFSLRAELEALSPRDFLADHFVVGLRTAAGISLSEIERRFNLAPGTVAALLSTLCRAWAARGLLATDLPPDQLALSPAGRAVLNPLLVDILEALDALESSESLEQAPIWP